MILLALGLVLFLGMHSVRIVAPDARAAAIERFGEGAWKGLYAAISLVGLMLVGRGWGEAERDVLYTAPEWSVPLSLILMAPLFVLLVAGNLPAGRIRAWTRHPMLIATVGWAALHVLNNGDTAAVLLFAAIGVWAALDIASLLSREREAALAPVGHAHAGASPHGAAAPEEPASALPWWPDIAAVIVGLSAYAWFVAYGHEWLFGVSPLG